MDEFNPELQEEILAFKGYQRLLKRQLQAVRDALSSGNRDKAIAMLDELIADTQKSLED